MSISRQLVSLRPPLPFGSYSWALKPSVTAWSNAARLPKAVGISARLRSRSTVSACSRFVPRGGTPLSTPPTGFEPTPASSSSVVLMVSKSKIEGRHGTRTRSEVFAASMAARSARGGVSITTRSAPPSSAALRTCAKRAGCAETTAGESASRRSPQLLAVACGSKSTIAAVRPAPLRGHSERDYQGGFPCAAFLGNDCDDFHGPLGHLV